MTTWNMLPGAVPATEVQPIDAGTSVPGKHVPPIGTLELVNIEKDSKLSRTRGYSATKICTTFSVFNE
jgi:hypothetical protein